MKKNPAGIDITTVIKNKKAVLIIFAIVLFCILLLCCCCTVLFFLPNHNMGLVEGIDIETRFAPTNTNIPTPTEELWNYSQVISITDGDTIRINYEGKEEKARFLSVEAPELSYPTEPIECYAEEFKSYLESILLNKEVHIEFDTKQRMRDQYDRLLIYVWLKREGPDLFINENLISEGYASVYRDSPSDYKDEFIKIGIAQKELKLSRMVAAHPCVQFQQK